MDNAFRLPKRRLRPRVYRSCQRCRVMKVRCDEEGPRCSACLSRGVECVRDTSPRPSSTSLQRTTFEHRLRELETSLNIKYLSPINEPSAATTTVASSAGDTIDAMTTFGSPEFQIYNSPAQSSPIDTETPVNHQGAATVLNLPEGKTIQLETLTNQPKSARPKGISLPPREDILALVKIWLDEINAGLPILPASFLASCDRTINEEDRWNEPSFWCCLNAVLAMAVLRISGPDNFKVVSSISWSFFRNALAVYPDLVMRKPDLIGIQAILCMILFLGGTADTRTMMLLISTAVRMVETLGRHLDGLGVSSETEHGRRVFWMVYLMDSMTQTHFGLTSNLHQQVLDMALPSESPSDGLGFVFLSNGNTINFFRSRVQISIIELEAAEIERQVMTRSCVSHIEAALTLLDKLDKVFQSLPAEHAPRFKSQPSIDIEDFPVVILHCSYYECVSTIHRIILCCTNRGTTSCTALPSDELLTRLATAPRATIGLLQCVNTVPFSDLWILLRFQLCAAISLLEMILNNAFDADAISNLKLIESLIKFLHNLKQQGYVISSFWDICIVLVRVGKVACGRAPQARDGPLDGDLFDTLDMHTSLEELCAMLKATKPMHVAQGLIGNVPALTKAASSIFSHAIQALSSSNGSVIFAPDSLQPPTEWLVT